MTENGSLLDDGLKLFHKIRNAPGSQATRDSRATRMADHPPVGARPPHDVNPLRGPVDRIIPTLTVLVKTVEDRPLAQKVAKQWRSELK